MRVTHLISNLDVGGAENSLAALARLTAGRGVENTVISFLSGGALAAQIEHCGATVIELGGSRGVAGAAVFLPAARALRNSRPDIVQAWMYHANFAATMARCLRIFRCPLVWNVRQSAENINLDKALTRHIIRLSSRLSALPDRIVYNSTHGATTHEALGFHAASRRIIVNGVDCERFRPREGAAEWLKQQLRLPSDAILIGRVARYAPMKDYPTLLAAFSTVLSEFPKAYLILAGEGCSKSNGELMGLLCESGCGGRVRLLGSRNDIEQIYPALDLFVSSSLANEGFPNVVAEAMACGAIVVTTAVGEPRLIRDGCHVVVAPNNAGELAAGMASMLSVADETRDVLSHRGREFILNNFSLESNADAYMTLYRELVGEFKLGAAV
jgi:glycosyltransferase involved in cell wall biosynthesis